MKMFRVIAFLFLLPGLSLKSQAQEVVAHASVDTNKILIGKPLLLTIQLSQPRSINIDWPLIIDSVGGMEIWKYTPPDTMKVDDKRILLRSQTFMITSYDSGTYVLPPVAFKYKLKGSDTEIKIETDPIRIDVFTVPVDTTQEIRDIRTVEEAPFDWTLVLWGVLAFHALLLVVALLVWALRKKEKIMSAGTENLAIVPAHIRALEELKKLDEEKVWQNGQLKAYYTRLTEALRTYMEGRWSLNTYELTSDEILSTSVIKALPASQAEELERVLRLADLVKFAKWQAIPAENEWAMQLSVKFVMNTAPAEVQVAQDEKESVANEGGEK